MQETFKRRATGTTVQPNGNLVTSIFVLGREEPEVELFVFVGLVADGQKTRVGLINVEVDVWDGACGAIDGELYSCCPTP